MQTSIHPAFIPSRALTAEELVSLEAMVDRTSLDRVLAGLGSIASDKAEHIACYSDSKSLIQRWDKAANLCFTLAEKLHKLLPF